MNTSVMNHDVHSPIFIRAKYTNDKPQTVKPARSIDWQRIIELMLLLSLEKRNQHTPFFGGIKKCHYG